MERRSKLHALVVNTLLTKWPSLKIKEEHKIGNNLFIDIFLPDYGIAIEVHGQQHFKYIPFFHGNLENSGFEYQKIRDNKKRLLCVNAGYLYYPIDDSITSEENIESVVNDIFAQYNLFLALKDVNDENDDD